MNAFEKVRLIWLWLPKVMEAIAVVEVALSPGTPGSEKKATVLSFLSKVSKQAKLPWGDDVVEALSGLIDTAIFIMNFVGRMRHGADAPKDVDQANVATILASPDPEVMRESVEQAAASDPALERFLLATDRSTA